jgi:hypothetical protein
MSRVSTVYVSSADAYTKKSDGEFTVLLGQTLRDVQAVELASASIPNTHSNIRQGDKLTMAVTGLSNFDVALTKGCYTSTSLIAHLKAKLDAADSDGDGVYTVSFSNETFRITIARQGSATFQVTPSSTRLARTLGFPVTPEAAANPQTGTTSVVLAPHNVIIASPQLRNPYLGGSRAATFVITHTEGAGAVSVYNSHMYKQIHRYPTPIRNLDRLSFTLLSVYDDDGVLDLSEQPVDFILRLTHD